MGVLVQMAKQQKKYEINDLHHLKVVPAAETKRKVVFGSTREHDGFLRWAEGGP